VAIRRATAGDLAAVLRIAREAFDRVDRPNAAWLVRESAVPGTELLVDDAGAGLVRGFVMIRTWPAGSLVRLVATDPNYRRQGVGRGLLARAVAPCGAWVREANAASRAMFAASGFADEGTRVAKDGGWIYYHLTAAPSFMVSSPGRSPPAIVPLVPA